MLGSTSVSTSCTVGQRFPFNQHSKVNSFQSIFRLMPTKIWTVVHKSSLFFFSSVTIMFTVTLCICFTGSASWWWNCRVWVCHMQQLQINERYWNISPAQSGSELDILELIPKFCLHGYCFHICWYPNLIQAHLYALSYWSSV